MKCPDSFKSPSTEPAPRPAAPSGARAAAAPPGLVTFKTSDTLEPHTVEIDRKAARAKRLRGAITTSSRLFDFWCGRRAFKPAMLTLTYRDVDGFRPLHITELLKCIREWMRRRGHRLRYVWVAELQQRGALHYHVLLWLPRGLTLPKPDKQGWWPHGSTRIEWARNAVGYLCKYVSKFDGDGVIPKGARLHGCGGLEDFAKQVRQWWNLPSWLRRLVGIGHSFLRVKGIGLVERETGICVQSPWRVSVSPGRITATQFFYYPESISDLGGPYCELPAR